jgi:hypothetical protein
MTSHIDINNATPGLDAMYAYDEAQDAAREYRVEDQLHHLRDECAKGIKETTFNISGYEYEAVYDEIFGYTCHELKAHNTFDRDKLSPDALQRIGLLVARKVCQQLGELAEMTA